MPLIVFVGIPCSGKTTRALVWNKRIFRHSRKKKGEKKKKKNRILNLIIIEKKIRPYPIIWLLSGKKSRLLTRKILELSKMKDTKVRITQGFKKKKLEKSKKKKKKRFLGREEHAWKNKKCHWKRIIERNISDCWFNELYQRIPLRNVLHFSSDEIPSSRHPLRYAQGKGLGLEFKKTGRSRIHRKIVRTR